MLAGFNTKLFKLCVSYSTFLGACGAQQSYQCLLPRAGNRLAVVQVTGRYTLASAPFCWQWMGVVRYLPSPRLEEDVSSRHQGKPVLHESGVIVPLAPGAPLQTLQCFAPRAIIIISRVVMDSTMRAAWPRFPSGVLDSEPTRHRHHGRPVSQGASKPRRHNP